MPVYNRVPRLPIDTIPSLPDNLHSTGDYLKLWDHIENERIISGTLIEFKTDNPRLYPLPSLDLLEMQWVLQRIAAMCGGAEEEDSDYSDDDDDDDDGYGGELEQEIESEEEMPSMVPITTENRPAPKTAGNLMGVAPLSVRNPNVSRWGR